MNVQEKVINSILEKVERTGQYYGEIPEYKHVVLPEYLEEALNISEEDLYDFLRDIEENYDIDFFSKRRNTGKEPLLLRHITSINNIDSIQEKGLILPDTDTIGNLGHGIYAVLADGIFDDGNDNLRDWLSCAYYEDIEAGNSIELAEVIFEYSGDYYECIYGNDVTGYILIKKNIPPNKLSIKRIDLYDFI